MPKIDLAAVPKRAGSGYPSPFDGPCADRVRQRLGNAGGLADFGVNLMRLPLGAWSSQRHWHSHEDEFVFVLEGELTLVDDDGETLLGCVPRELRQPPSPDQQVRRAGDLSRGRLASSRRRHNVLRHRHDERQR